MLAAMDARTRKHTRSTTTLPDEARVARRDDHRQARPAARVADPDRRHRPDRRAAVRAARRRRILPAGDRRAGGRDRAGAAARMVRAARRAVAARRRPVRHHLPGDRDLRDRLDRHSGERLGRAGPDQRSPKVRAALEPVLDLYKNLDRFIDRTSSQIAVTPQHGARRCASRRPIRCSACSTTSAPHLLIQLFFALLVIFFFLAGWTAMRKQTIVSRGSFEGALTTARVIQQVVDATSTYLGTITLINIGLGALTALVLWRLGMPIAGDVGRHRRGAQLHPLSRPDRLGAAAVLRRADDLSRRLGGAAAAGGRSSASTWSRPISSRRWWSASG